MPRAATQAKLFDTGTNLPNGFVYRPNFLTNAEEVELLEWFQDLPFEHSTSAEGYVAKRRVINFGWSYDFESGKLIPGPPLPPFLQPVARKIAKWLDIPKYRVAEALISEYEPGAAIGWHRDNESFDSIIGVSLAGWARMRLRPLESARAKTLKRKARSGKEVVSIEVEPRSAYLMQKESRWNYQHSIAKLEALRYSITFRTLPAHIRR
jgi:alkylated DNA repair dioxygenase AlkB